MEVVIRDELLLILILILRVIFRGSRGSRVICRKEAAGLVLAGPVAGDDESLSIQNPAVGIDGIAFFQERFEGTVGNDRMFMA